MEFGIATGDIVLFSGNQLTGSIIKWFTNDKWNHMGIGVWLDRGIVTRNTGEFCILEMSNQHRFDALTNSETQGPSFTKYEGLKSRKYNTLGIRAMKESYRTVFINNLLLVQQQYNNLSFSNQITKFIQGWLGYRYHTNIYSDGVFCTEYAAMIYSRTLNMDINQIFEVEDITCHTCTPLTYSQANTEVFVEDLIIHQCKNDYFMNSTILLLVITFIIVLAAIVITILVDRAFVRRREIECEVK